MGERRTYDIHAGLAPEHAERLGHRGIVGEPAEALEEHFQPGRRHNRDEARVCASPMFCQVWRTPRGMNTKVPAGAS